MKNLAQKITPFLLLSILGISCKHKCEKDPDSVFCPGCKQDQSLDGMKDYFFFKTGTWWVYQEQSTGALDTVTVFYSFEGLVGGYPYFEWQALSSYNDYYFIHVFDNQHTIHCLTDKDCDCYKLNRAKARPGDYVGGGRYFTYPIIKGNKTYDDGESKVVEFYSKLQIGDSTYNSIAEFDLEVDESAFHTGHHTAYRVAKNKGILEFFNFTLNEHWQIESFHVVQ